MALLWFTPVFAVFCAIVPVQAAGFAERRLGLKTHSHSRDLPNDVATAVDDLDAVEAELQEPELTVDQTSLRHSSRHRASLAAARSADLSRLEDESMDLEDSINADDMLGPDLSPPLMGDHPGIIPLKAEGHGAQKSKYHPLVERALGSMDDSLRALAHQQASVANKHEIVSEDSYEMADELTNAQSLHRKLVASEVALKERQRQVERLKAEEAHIQATHDKLLARLNDVSGKRINALKHRLHTRRLAWKKAANDLEKWRRTEANYKATALESLKERREAKAALSNADAELVAAQQKQEQAHQEFLAARTEASQEVEAYQNVATHLKAVENLESDKKVAVGEQEKSAKKIVGVFDYEGHRIEDALVASRAKLHARIKSAQKRTDQANATVVHLKQELKEWKTEELSRLADSHNDRNVYEQSLRSYDARRKEILDTAQAKAVQRARHNDDWAEDDDWAWHNESGGTDPEDDI